MAKATNPGCENAPEKLVRLPKDVKISKRPLLRAAIPSPYAGRDHQKVVYLSSKTPFMSAFKRIQQLFKHIEKRATQSEVAHHQKRGNMGRVPQAFPSTVEDSEVVTVKATGKAIDKALSLALFVQEQTEYRVKVSTSSLAAIDDIEVNPMSSSLDVNSSTEIPESRIRHTSVVEIHITLA